MPTHIWRRAFGLLLPIALLFGAFSSTDHATASGTRHPHFNDGGTLRWHHSFAEAKRVALNEGKLIFVEYGRLRCSNCKKLAERVLPHPSIRGRMSSIAIGLAAECDQPERAIWALFKQNLPRARTLPFVAFLTPKGRWITGWAGYKGVSEVSAALRTAEARHTSLMTARRRFEQREEQKTRQAKKTPRTPPPTRAEPELASPTRPSPASKPAAAPKPTATPTARPTPCPADDHPDDCCPGGNCEVDLDGVPKFKESGPLAFTDEPCPPGKAATKTAPATAKRGDTCPTTGKDLEKHDRVEQPKRHLAIAKTPTASGDPDAGGTMTFPAPADVPTLPQPAIVAKPARKILATGNPDGPDLPTPRRVTPQAPTRRTTTATVAAATAAAAEGDWMAVLQHTRGSSKEEQPLLFALNRQAHSWAHARLASATRAIRQRRYSEADRAIVEVKHAMRGEAEAVDAERGAEAIELMRDIEPLAEKSLVRRTVRKTAYEKMRGTRWAPLFSPVPQAGAAVAKR